MKKLKQKHSRCKFIKCPICNSKTFEYVSYSEFWIGTVEQHGYCHRCGYVVEQDYSPICKAFWDVKKGFKHPSGEYVSKNVKKHKRIRRKLNNKNIEVNPLWIKYI